jgi:signal transduction histidine kinase
MQATRSYGSGSSDGLRPPGYLLVDAIVAVALTLFVWVGMWLPDVLFTSGRRFPRGVFPLEHVAVTPLAAFLIAAVCILPLALRRRFPVAVLVTSAVGFSLYQLLRFPPSLVLIGLLIALYSAGTMLERRRFLGWALLVCAIVIVASIPPWGTPLFWADLVRTAALLAGAGAIGDAVRNRRAYVIEVERRAAEAELTREEEARRRVDDERLRIARELHDITAHSLSIIAVQSGAAAHVIDTNPAEARKSLEAIRRTSRDALDELRAMLGVLRAGEEGDAPLAPAPSLSRLGDLIEPLMQAGYTVDADIDADLGEIPAVVEGSAYRIVQESLTNVVRHAGICRV